MNNASGGQLYRVAATVAIGERRWEYEWMNDTTPASMAAAASQTAVLCTFHTTSGNIMLIILFFAIFCLSVIGNSVVLVIITRQRWMRTVTNLVCVLTVGITECPVSAQLGHQRPAAQRRVHAADVDGHAARVLRVPAGVLPADRLPAA